MRKRRIVGCMVLAFTLIVVVPLAAVGAVALLSATALGTLTVGGLPRPVIYVVLGGLVGLIAIFAALTWLAVAFFGRFARFMWRHRWEYLLHAGTHHHSPGRRGAA